MRRFHAFGISAAVPAGWDARAFRHHEGEPTLHVASFRLPPTDGDFGPHATARMPHGAVFLSLTEYRPGGGVEAGGGLFGAEQPRSLAPGELSSRALQRARPHQRGLQRFFSAAGRAFCLYVVISGRAEKHLAEASRLLQTLRVESRAG